MKGKSTYYTLNPTLSSLSIKSIDPILTPQESNSIDKDGNSIDKDGNSIDKDGNSIDKDELVNQIPAELQKLIKNLGKRVNRNQMNDLIIALCKWRDLSSRELAIILNRDQVYLVNNYLNPLINSGSLIYRFPNNSHNPCQAYRANN